MKRLTIYTVDFEVALREFADGLEIVNVEWGRWADRKRIFGVCISWENAVNAQVVERLTIFLQELAALQNPIYKHLPKMREIAKNLRTTPAHGHEVQRLRNFLKGNRKLNIEGYILFRMSEYRHKLDILSYQVMRKMQKE